MDHDIIVLAASYGGVQALPRLIGGLPADLPAAVLVVLHTACNRPGLLPQLTGNVSALPVRHLESRARAHERNAQVIRKLLQEE